MGILPSLVAFGAWDSPVKPCVSINPSFVGNNVFHQQKLVTVFQGSFSFNPYSMCAIFTSFGAIHPFSHLFASSLEQQHQGEAVLGQ